MATAWCAGWGQAIEIPAGIASGEIFGCPNWAGLSLRASERDGTWTVTEVKTASCAAGDEPVILPDDVRPGDVVECHGVRQRVTYEFGAYALVKVEEGGPATGQPPRRRWPGRILALGEGAPPRRGAVGRAGRPSAAGCSPRPRWAGCGPASLRLAAWRARPA